MSTTAPTPPTRYRPSSKLCIPLQTGDGFASSLFLWAGFWMLALAVALVGLLLLILGHWIGGPLLMLIGAFFLGAWASFPRAVWVSRPCDLELDARGFRVVGGYHAGRALDWDSLDASASGLDRGEAVGAEILFAATRDGRKLPLAEGEEADCFRAVLDVFRASDGLEPLETPDEAADTPAEERTGKEPPQAKPAAVELVHCGQCGAVARPYDAPRVACLYCGHDVPLPDALRERLREFRSQTALSKRSQKLLERALSQPRASLAMTLLGALALAIIATWLFDSVVVARAIVHHALDFKLFVCALAAPLLVTLALCTLASVVSARRVAVRAISVDFAAIVPSEPGKPCSCHICGAPLPEHEGMVVRCAYCSSPNVIATARPRRTRPLRDQVHSLTETLEIQSTEQISRYIFVSVIGAPAMWGAIAALRVLWPRFG
jgi:DNA-directed RNA polymerase subunit RPC12/RpoP